MFQLHTSWWEPPVRAAILYCALLLLVRISGRRTVGQFTPFDLLVVMLLSESVSGALNGGEDSVTGGLLAAATLVALNIAIAFLTSHNKGAQALFDGRPVLIGRAGTLYAEVLKAHRVPLADVHQALREADCEEKDMQMAVLETNGQISILKEASGPSDDVT
ncbi:MAG: YetF domain-containing protein [Pseudomonadota bacterium]